MTDQSPKNRLQEYCQKEKIPLPIYRLKKQINTHLGASFQTEVEVNGQQFLGEGYCRLKIISEQSAAKKACKALIEDDIDHSLDKHLPPEYADIEKFIAELVGHANGRIRKIRLMNDNRTYRFEITGSYKYCEKVQRHHKSNHIYFIVDPFKRTFFQKCYDPDCQGFRSRSKPIIKGQSTVIAPKANNIGNKCPSCQLRMNRDTQMECETCAKIHCYECLSRCDFCRSNIECSKCQKRCSDDYELFELKLFL